MNNIIAEHKRIEQTLRHLILAAEHSTQAIAIFDLNGTLRFANKAWAMMHGYESSNELLGKSIRIFHTDEQMKTDVIDFIEETKLRGQLEGPINHLRSNRMVFPTHTKMTAAKNEQGRTIGLIAFATDVSQTKQTEELLKHQTAELNAAKKQLQNQIAKCRQAEYELQQCRNQLDKLNSYLRIAKAELQKQSAERQQLENELQQYCDRFEQQTAELASAINKVIQFAESGSQLLCHKT